MAVKKTGPAVDVIVPTYNGMPWLKETIASVLNQSHENFTLYIIDDGSTDNGATEKYVKAIKDPRVIYHRKDNGGQATARNLGIELSSSPYITLLDSDDLWHKDKLKKQLQVMGKNAEVGLVYAFCRLIDANDKPVGKVVYAARGKLFRYLLGGNRISGSASMVMVRRSVFDKIGVFKEDFLIGEDWEMWLRIARDYEIDYLPMYLADLRVLDNGMQKNQLKMARGLEYMFYEMSEDLKLGPINKARLAATCFHDAMIFYYDGNDIRNAHKSILRFLWYNPLMFINTFEWWRRRHYLRMLIANEPVRIIRRTVSPGYRQREIESKRQKDGV